MSSGIQPAELGFFVSLGTCGSLNDLESGRLVQVLPQYRTPDADIYAVYPQHQHQSARVRTLVAFLAQAFERFVQHRGHDVAALEG